MAKIKKNILTYSFFTENIFNLAKKYLYLHVFFSAKKARIIWMRRLLARNSPEGMI